MVWLLIKENLLVTVSVAEVEFDESCRDEIGELTAKSTKSGKCKAPVDWTRHWKLSSLLWPSFCRAESYRKLRLWRPLKGKASALDSWVRPAARPFFYIQSFSRKEPFRQDTCVGAHALHKSLLHPKLSEWTLAVYEPNSACQMTSQEVRCLHSRLHEQETYQEQEEWENKVARLSRQDASYFIRAGFRQVMLPSLARDDSYHFFCKAI
jgi:hypothetical protein